MKKHLIDISPVAEDITSATAHFAGIRADLASILHSLEESQRKHTQKIGRRNETWCMEVMEVARQHPQVIPASIDMAALERDIAGREIILPLLIASRQMNQLLEDTYLMLGADFFNGSRGLYKSMKIVAALHGLEAIVASLGEHFARGPRKTGAPSETSTTTPPPAE
jgi:hypothetical protein